MTSIIFWPALINKKPPNFPSSSVYHRLIPLPHGTLHPWEPSPILRWRCFWFWQLLRTRLSWRDAGCCWRGLSSQLKTNTPSSPLGTLTPWQFLYSPQTFLRTWRQQEENSSINNPERERWKGGVFLFIFFSHLYCVCKRSLHIFLRVSPSLSLSRKFPFTAITYLWMEKNYRDDQKKGAWSRGHPDFSYRFIFYPGSWRHLIAFIISPWKYPGPNHSQMSSSILWNRLFSVSFQVP